ncbi:hypothetical protein PRIPAC_80647 [Pristionchus pacificus]|uniref:Uncharacterized protein n=1 Tax=Pristionchus pacificus TaxID=54126 RepID=A0A2A6CJG6_PRIPA|nr:hypothetical protein PRIPAC_80647 [Pristionchus pacificus]|eukprot:PDM78250.1 hypothetical protein PRIPAC_30829 [Pristionchus pacificus]
MFHSEAEPGIPATTTTTTTTAPMKPCAPYGPAPPADCAAAGGCGTAPIITATKISCAGGKNVMIIHRTAAGQPELKKIAAWAECRDGIWYNSDSPNKLDNNPNAPFRPPVTIGCSQ